MKWLYLIMTCSVLLLTDACSKSPQLPPLSPSATILAFGDSLTAGYGASEAESYPANLAQLTARRVVNAGIPGEVSADGLLRLPELLEREKPALLVLCHGGNDLLRHLDQRQLADNLRGMVKLAREKGIAVILVAVPAPDLSLKPPPLYEEIAKEFDLPLESKTLATIMAKGSLKSDHIHPNAAGYRKLAEALFSLLNKSGAL
ncbi:MAG: arylesterase [Geobacter sp.]|nr:arylesterase [Geobacter sp.]